MAGHMADHSRSCPVMTGYDDFQPKRVIRPKNFAPAAGINAAYGGSKNHDQQQHLLANPDRGRSRFSVTRKGFYSAGWVRYISYLARP